MTVGPPEADETLGEAGEAEWVRMERQLYLADGFWLGFVFSPSLRAVAILRQRVARLLKEEGRSLRLIRPDTPGELRAEIGTLLSQVAAAGACTWVEAIRLDRAHDDAEAAAAAPWQTAWDTLLLRLNEHRESLREYLPGGLVLAGPSELKPRVREAAPDLWHIRSIVVELEHQAERDPDKSVVLKIKRNTILGLGASSPRRLTSSDRPPRPESPSAVSGIPPNVVQGQALLRDAEQEIASGAHAEALKKLSRAATLLEAGDPLASARAYLLAAMTEAEQGNKNAAPELASRAISLRERASSGDAPVAWYTFAATLSLVARDFTRASDLVKRGQKAARRIEKVASSPESRAALGEILDVAGKIAMAMGDRARALLHWRLARGHLAHAVRAGMPDAARSYLNVTQVLGDALVEAGRQAEAIVTFEDGLATAEELLTKESPSADHLRNVSIFQNRLGLVFLAAGDAHRAVPVLEKAVAIRRRLHAEEPANAARASDLASSLDKLADAFEAIGRPDKAVRVEKEARLLRGEDP